MGTRTVPGNVIRKIALSKSRYATEREQIASDHRKSEARRKKLNRLTRKKFDEVKVHAKEKYSSEYVKKKIDEAKTPEQLANIIGHDELADILRPFLAVRSDKEDPAIRYEFIGTPSKAKKIVDDYPVKEKKIVESSPIGIVYPELEKKPEKPDDQKSVIEHLVAPENNDYVIKHEPYTNFNTPVGSKQNSGVVKKKEISEDLTHRFDKLDRDEAEDFFRNAFEEYKPLADADVKLKRSIFSLSDAIAKKKAEAKVEEKDEEHHLKENVDELKEITLAEKRQKKIKELERQNEETLRKLENERPLPEISQENRERSKKYKEENQKYEEELRNRPVPKIPSKGDSLKKRIKIKARSLKAIPAKEPKKDTLTSALNTSLKRLRKKTNLDEDIEKFDEPDNQEPDEDFDNVEDRGQFAHYSASGMKPISPSDLPKHFAHYFKQKGRKTKARKMLTKIKAQNHIYKIALQKGNLSEDLKNHIKGGMAFQSELHREIAHGVQAL